MKKPVYSTSQLFWLVALRVLIGWYFLYEGLIKALNPKWTSMGYLLDSKGWFAPLFKELTANSTVMMITDMINIYGLIIIGLCLVMGCFARYAAYGAIALLSLYYLSHPPLLDAGYMMPTEGSYLWVDKNMVMLCALAIVILFPTSKHIGLDRAIYKKKLQE